MQDLKAKGPLKEKSRRVLEIRFENLLRVLSFSFHGESMGAGVTLKSDQTPGKWTMVVPNTTAAVVFQVASVKTTSGENICIAGTTPTSPPTSLMTQHNLSEGDKGLNASSSESPGGDKNDDSAASPENSTQPETNNK